MASREHLDRQLQRSGYPDVLVLNGLIWPLFKVIDAHPEISVSVVSDKVEDGTLFSWLHVEYQLPRPRDEAAVLDYLRRAINAEDYGVTSSGLLLLMTHYVEALQQILGTYRDALPE